MTADTHADNEGQSRQHRPTHWFPNSAAMKRKPDLRTHILEATGTVSKYFRRISVTYNTSTSGKSDGPIQLAISLIYKNMTDTARICFLKNYTILYRNKNGVLNDNMNLGEMKCKTYNVFICLQCHLEDVSLFRLYQEEKHGLQAKSEALCTNANVPQRK